MNFNSIIFFVFLTIVFILYWYVFKKRIAFQNSLLLIASYVFYGWWDWRFLFLIAISSLVDFVVGILLFRTNEIRKRKILLGVSLVANLGLLSVFKYFNFFIESFVDFFNLFGIVFQHSSLSIILPVGISFYTLQTLSYTFDIYNKKMEPTKNIITFFAFVSFFPQLVAGPIERAKNLLPQFEKRRVFNYMEATHGLRYILWGLFKKIVVADTLAITVNSIFSASDTMSSFVLFSGMILFVFQIYADFSGYSDIAIGSAKLFGFTLMTNFAYPLFSRDIAEFWRRWHISLTTWFRDYVYIPLGGSRVSKIKQIRNVFIIFILSGFWHGANMKFIMWGIISALTFMPLLLSSKNRTHLNKVAEGKRFPSLKEFYQMLLTIIVFGFPLIFFRSENVRGAILYIQRMFTTGSFSIEFLYTTPWYVIIVMLIFEWRGRAQNYPLEKLSHSKYMRFAIYAFLGILIMTHITPAQPEFIYFQF